MPTEITQKENADSIVFHVNGEMHSDDAELLERLVMDAHHPGRRIVIDLADLDLLDSDAAPALRRIQARENVSIEGIEIFLQSAVDTAERSGDYPLPDNFPKSL